MKASWSVFIVKVKHQTSGQDIIDPNYLKWSQKASLARSILIDTNILHRKGTTTTFVNLYTKMSVITNTSDCTALPKDRQTPQKQSVYFSMFFSSLVPLWKNRQQTPVQKSDCRVCYDVMHMALCESCCWLETKLERETEGKSSFPEDASGWLRPSAPVIAVTLH